MSKSQGLSQSAQTPIVNKARRCTFAIQALYTRQGIAGKLLPAYRGARHLSLDVRLSDPLKLDKAIGLAENIALASAAQAVIAQRLEGVVSYQIELPGALWESYTRQDLPGPHAIGLGERRRPVVFELDPPHVLIAGATQTSGKSTTVKSILVSLMTTRPVTDLAIVLIDPNRDYLDFSNEAHLIRFEFGSIAHSAEDASTALLWANQTLSYRISEDVKDGQTLAVVIDEAESVLTGDNLKIAQFIAKQGAKYQVHLIVATQEPTQSKLPGVVSNCLNRFVGQLGNANLSATISGHSGLMAHKLTPRGDFLHLAGPLSERFQVAQATRRDFDRLERLEQAPVKVEPVTVEPAALVKLPAELPTSESGGRPAIQVSPQYAAWYFFNNPDQISRGMAQKVLGLSQRGHEVHKRFVQEFIIEYLRLRNQRGIGA